MQTPGVRTKSKNTLKAGEMTMNPNARKDINFGTDMEMHSLKDALWRLTTRVILLEDFITENFDAVLGSKGYTTISDESIFEVNNVEIDNVAKSADISTPRCKSARKRKRGRGQGQTKDHRGKVQKEDIANSTADNSASDDDFECQNNSIITKNEDTWEETNEDNSIPMIENTEYISGKTVTRDVQFEKKLLKSLSTIQATLKLHGELLAVHKKSAPDQNSKSDFGNRPVKLPEDSPLHTYTFPLATEEEVKDLEEMISNEEEAKEDLAFMLTSYATGSIEDGLKKMLMKLFADDITASFSLKGMRGKKSFSALSNIKEAIHDAFFQSSDFSSTDPAKIDEGISGALKKAADRVAQRNRKKKYGDNEISEK